MVGAIPRQGRYTDVRTEVENAELVKTQIRICFWKASMIKTEM